MKISRIGSADFRLPFRSPFRAGGNQFEDRGGILLWAETEDGVSGAGEVSPLPGFSLETVEEAKYGARKIGEALIGETVPADPEGLAETVADLKHRLDSSPSVVFGFETLLGDLAARQARLPLCQWFDRNALKQVPVNAVLSGSHHRIREQLARGRAAGVRVWKVKVDQKAEKALETLATIREMTPGGISLRLDCNRSLGLDEALRLLKTAASFSVEYVEEPLRAPTWQELKALREATGIPIALDETIRDERRFSDILSHGACDVVVLKPTVLGGISETLRLSRMASREGLRTVVTSTLESGVGVAACLHAAALAGPRLLPCGLDTIELFEESLILESLPVAGGRMKAPERPGLGVTINWESRFLRPEGS